MKQAKRYSVELDTWTEHYWDDSNDFTELKVVESPTGGWVKHREYELLYKKTLRMQCRIDKLEGRS